MLAQELAQEPVVQEMAQEPTEEMAQELAQGPTEEMAKELTQKLGAGDFVLELGEKLTLELMQERGRCRRPRRSSPSEFPACAPSRRP
ncbi:hypothetical protein PF005_g24918 [Phytophthora fragariae]|uniref:Uncharacterized protein n=1 Tax=Phytophthora fragariae TaxID=53985 RepID=A0A6A3DYR4_9STRA|nr:hypothetical protein PF003_g33480 [Phytophthora fragariae]KAE8924481.1 hypothetical protein PF009_g25284 [Phytophthora fragariae]KAE8978326.1 hypothetical protein PF011_g23292 [Phytophthora fragariae]KAE9075942.1 hypothetical protein PF010_g24104 [Phytophthora fragariae]KAE9077767.1 hypothetical protein PF007_g24121 [Phytophthora fragariae]